MKLIPELKESIDDYLKRKTHKELLELLKSYESMLLNAGDLTQEIKDQDRDDFIEAFNCA
tara:strand:+ start:733 stop:912 length:180 start_codon:yes stop_codon:yes gene_type:complete